MFEKETSNGPQTEAAEQTPMLPMVDVTEDASGITLYADLPGVQKDKLSVRVEADSLSIEGEISLPWVKDLQVNHIEVPVPRYARSFTLGKELDRDKVSAEFKQGVLRLHIPKVEHVKPRKIEVVVA
ncbi:MAG: Hsp20/alpha crystallin family protein [Rhodoferax sp.]|uniref:Hsp20/alpha crystallin family protein n=1 Tax=Rhodoferax sp. TaxID=50421 RepID=UPI001B5D955B|nr:Hsp20/alpha crystallin family protein [Rhodoferax sp.]MBP9906061.1 Hsp20/alpha crystallin family protein [Rhodoferax sp.]